ncbi:hypothetical protein LCM02_08625 [Lutimonas saemankumensis]|uniref:hypothetical protein n=1 Tax=Lutimonas saemankumensis TaxID=483016 RepID=UPI001CD38536|nr:hypothetical protein [Lutimonas saemankumensis]MCA0932514.1 hypothetical protein [Lutimonas saemankumensis]
MRLLFFILFIGLSSYAQKIKLEYVKDYQNSSLDTLKQEFYIFFKDRVLTVNLNDFKRDVRPLTLQKGLSEDVNYLENQIITANDTLYFVSNSGGMVYMIKNDTIKRIDKSFNHQMQYGSFLFEHDETAFKYGGYGFWSDRDFFTYYLKNQDEWDVYQPDQGGPIPPGISNLFGIKQSDRVYIFGGESVNPKNRRERIMNYEAWSYNFRNGKWKFLGKHDPFDITVRYIKIKVKNKLLLVDKNEIIEIDIENNTKTIFKHGPVSAQVRAIVYGTYWSGKFYLVMGSSGNHYLNIVDEEDFLGPVVSQAKFYRNNSFWIRQILILVLSIALLVTVFLIGKSRLKKINKLQILDNGLKYRNKFREFKPDSMEILKLLLEKKEVPSSEILNLVEKEQYSPAHNERIKIQKIKDINLKIATLLGKDGNVITSYKSKHDRRIRVYTIDDSLF